MIAIIDYNAGNLTSVAHAITHLGFKCKVTNDIRFISEAEKIIFPGVGAAGSAMESLKRLGLDQALKKAFSDGKPVFGICLGTQIIMQYSQENDTECIGIIDGSVKPFQKNMTSENGSKLKIPHMGWNKIYPEKDHPLLLGLKNDDEFYFVHSFYPAPEHKEHVVAKTDYGIRFPSIIGFDNIFATQFHPEKSGKPGLVILNNFCRSKPC
ncbi:MAG: imidazole glycerol phosphate synthase subunit HisH [Deltaproteobacteria bacterium]|nr:imidazole glycerol phosphate synthase subunit HisH [Deltaproteobacteria bacterium]